MVWLNLLQDVATFQAVDVYVSALRILRIEFTENVAGLILLK